MDNSLDFLTRLTTAGLLSAAKITELEADAQLVELAPQQVAEELVRRKLISKYQARTLLTHREPKFDYGSYRVVGRYTTSFRAGLFQAVHRATGQPVEIDLVDVTVDREIGKHCQVRHANLSDCYEMFDQDGQTLVALERVAGPSLTDVLKGQSISTRTACRVVQQAASACWALHANGLTHGQICPAALVVVSPTQVRLLRRPGRELADNATGQVAERLRSLSAETTAPERDDDGRMSCEMDVYSLGRILELLLASSGQQVAALSKLIASLVAISPANRLRHAGAVAAALAEFSVPDDVNPSVKVGSEPVGPAEERLKKYSSYLASRRADVPDANPHESDPPTMQYTAEGASPTELLRTRRRHARRKQIVWGAIIGLFTVVGGMLISQSFPSDGELSSNPAANGNTRVTADPTDVDRVLPTADPAVNSPSTASDIASEEVGGDDGRSLWASPTDGAAIDLKYVPAGAQLCLHARPAAILAQPQGRRSLKALGPAFGSLQQAWEDDLGASLEQVDDLIAAVVPRDAGRPEISWVIRLHSGTQVPDKWSLGRQVTVDDQTISVDGDRAIWVSPAGSLVLGSETAVRDAIANRESRPLLRRELERLRSASDAEQVLTILFTPNFVAAEGKKIIASQLHSILPAMGDMFGDQTRGCLTSLHLDGEQFYGEVRLASTTKRGPVQQARELLESVARIPRKMESTVSSLATLDPYWRRLALRAVPMVDFAVEHIRTDVEDRTVVANFSLPPQAAHNLLLLIELTTAARQATGDTVATTANDTLERLTLDEVLATKISLDIPQQSIEFALRDLASELNSELAGGAAEIVIRIDGSSLQAEGITRNQQIRGFRRDDTTVAEILTGLVMVANPVTTVKTPDERDQKLVWVAHSSGEPSSGNGRIILITTRKAALENGYSLPVAFRAK